MGIACALPGDIGFWLIRSWLCAPLLLPLAALGLGVGQQARRPACLAVLLWGIGLLGGSVWHVRVMTLLAPVPGAISHQFFALPIAAVTVGAALLPGAQSRLSRYMLPFAALTGGIAYALRIALGNPGDEGDLRVPVVGGVLGLWLLVLSAVAARLPAPRATGIGSRIAGSWLIAIGLLYGGLGLSGASPGADAFPDFGLPPAAPTQP